jgi:hypothetical protein
VREDDREVAGVDRRVRDRGLHRAGLGTGQQHVLAGDVGDPAVAADLGRPQPAPEPTRATGGVEHEVGVEALTVDPQPDGVPLLGEHLLGVALVERHPGLGDHRRAQHPFERHASTPQPEHPLRLVREHRGLGARREQRVEHVGRLGPQRVDDLRPERVRVVERCPRRASASEV